MSPHHCHLMSTLVALARTNRGMKYATVAQVAALGLFSQATLGQDMRCDPRCGCCETCYGVDCSASFASGEIRAPSGGRKLLEEDASGVSGQVLMKLFGDGGHPLC